MVHKSCTVFFFYLIIVIFSRLHNWHIIGAQKTFIELRIWEIILNDLSNILNSLPGIYKIFPSSFHKVKSKTPIWNWLAGKHERKSFLCILFHIFQVIYHVNVLTRFVKDCCYSVTKLCLTLCNPMYCTTQTSLYFTISQSLFKLMSIELVMLSNHLIL